MICDSNVFINEAKHKYLTLHKLQNQRNFTISEVAKKICQLANFLMFFDICRNVALNMEPSRISFRFYCEV